MSYHDLSQSTLSPEEMRAEAQRICARIAARVEDMTERERVFVVAHYLHPARSVSVKELFWLRDLNERY
jgi:hypothetical protein